MRALGLLLVAVAATANAAPKKPTALAVIVVHDDDRIAGEVQQRLESKVGVSSDIRLRPSSSLVVSTVAREDGTAKRVEAILTKAKDAYWEEQLDLALTLVREAEGELRESRYHSFDTARISQWRAALLLAKQDEFAADRETRAALAIAPDMQVDLDIFRPSVAKLFERIRAATPQGVAVSIAGAPAGARFWIDERIVGARTVVTPGAHRLHVEANGYRTLDHAIDVTSSVTIQAGMAPALPAKTSAILIAFAGGKTLDDNDRATLSELLARSKADAVAVVARSENGLRARTFDGKQAVPPSGAVPQTAAGESSRVEWSLASVGGAPAGRAAARMEWSAQAGVVAASRSWELRSADGGRLSLGYSGSGAGLDLRARQRAVRIEASGAYVDFGSKKEQVDLGATQATAAGGSMLSGRIGAGYELSAGRVAIVPGIAFALDHFDSAHLRDQDGDLGLLPSMQRVALDAQARVDLPLSLVPNARPAVFSLHGAVSPWSSWRTTPAKSLGESSTGDVSFGWGASMNVGLPKQWATRIAYDGHRRSVTFDGTGSAPVDPTVRDARGVEVRHAVSVSFGRDF